MLACEVRFSKTTQKNVIYTLTWRLESLSRGIVARKHNAKRTMSSITRMLQLTRSHATHTGPVRGSSWTEYKSRVFSRCSLRLLSQPYLRYTRLAATCDTQRASCQPLVWITFFATINHAHTHTYLKRPYKHCQCVSRMCTGSGIVKGRLSQSSWKEHCGKILICLQAQHFESD